MDKICAWCGNKINKTKSSHQADNDISHGMCEDCADNLLFQWGVDIKKYIEKLNIPVVIVDSEGVVNEANSVAKNFLNKDIAQIKGFKGGDVFECAYSRLPGGCGNTVHCSGCTIRNTVMKTYETGKSSFRVKAYLKMYKPDRPQDIRFLISTIKINDVVLLAIEDVEKEE